MKPNSLSLDVLCITHPLNTPCSGQEPSQYFVDHPSRGDSTAPSYPTTLSGSLLDLPTEILVYILELGYFDFNADGAPDAAFRTLASQTSTRLRQLVLHTPSLWSIIRVSPNNAFSQMYTCIDRSLEYPLDIRLRCFWESRVAEEIMEKLVSHIDRWRRLSMTVVDDFIFMLLGRKAAPLLEYLDISFHGPPRRISTPPRIFGGHLPRLTHLCLRHVDINLGFPLGGIRTLEIRGYGTWPAYPQLNELLGGSECLESLTFHISPSQVLAQVFPDAAWDSNHSRIHVPELRSLTILTSEWLSPNISNFIRLFSFPKLETLTLLLHEYPPSNQKPQRIMVYTRGTTPLVDEYLSTPEHLPNRLVLQTCSLFWGCRALSSSPITTLELRDVHWPDHSTLRNVFESLKDLKNLFIQDFNPKRAVLGLLNDHENETQSIPFFNLLEMEATIALPHLERLVVEFTERAWSAQDSTQDYTTAFLRVFSLPAIRTLHFAKIRDAAQWKAIVDTFASHVSEYHSLASLTLTDMSDLVPTDPRHPHYTDLAAAFPHLQHLSLDGLASSNALLQQLVLPSPLHLHSIPPPADSSAPKTAFADLRFLSVRGDPNVSKPLFHRVIAARERAGAPLMRLRLDHHFASNAESLEWIQDRVEVVEVGSVLVEESSEL